MTSTHRRIMTLGITSTHRHRHLGGDGLLPHQSFGTAIGFLHRMRVVNSVVGLPQARQISLLTQPFGQGVLKFGGGLEQHRLHRGDLPGAQLRGLRVETEQTVTLHLRSHHLALLAACHDLAVAVNHDEVGVNELRVAPELPHLADEDAVSGGRKNALPIGHDVGFAEKGDGQTCVAVGQHDFQTLTRSPLSTCHGLVGVDLDADDVGHQGDFGVNDEVGQIRSFGTGEVATRKVAEGLAHRLDVHRSECFGRLGSHRLRQRAMKLLLAAGVPPGHCIHSVTVPIGNDTHNDKEPALRRVLTSNAVLSG